MRLWMKLKGPSLSLVDKAMIVETREGRKPEERLAEYSAWGFVGLLN